MAVTMYANAQGPTPPGGLETIHFAQPAGQACDSYSGGTKIHRVGPLGTYGETSSSAVNGHITTTPTLRRNSSTIQTKTDIQDLTDEEANIIYKLRPVTYTSLCPIDNPDLIFPGLIAEEVVEIDPALVTFQTKKSTLNEFNEEVYEDLDVPIIDGVSYIGLSALLQKIVKTQNDQINLLEEEIDSILSEINTINQKII